MGKPRIITASPDCFITDGVTTHYFPDNYHRENARYFLDHGANVLYALAVDYPGLYKIPLEYRELARKELKKLGFKTSRPKYQWENGRLKECGPWAQLFFLGPKEYRSSFGTNRKNATSFKIWFGSWGGLK
jgi:hypothetical protein